MATDLVEQSIGNETDTELRQIPRSALELGQLVHARMEYVHRGEKAVYMARTGILEASRSHAVDTDPDQATAFVIRPLEGDGNAASVPALMLDAENVTVLAAQNVRSTAATTVAFYEPR
jgi:hypothetical protein